MTWLKIYPSSWYLRTESPDLGTLVSLSQSKQVFTRPTNIEKGTLLSGRD